MKNDKLDGKIAVVTGASKGIGAAIAKEFAKAGAFVVVNYASAKQDADRVVDEISKKGRKAVAVQANVAKKAEVERLSTEAEKALARLTSWSTTPASTSSSRWKKPLSSNSTECLIQTSSECSSPLRRR